MRVRSGEETPAAAHELPECHSHIFNNHIEVDCLSVHEAWTWTWTWTSVFYPLRLPCRIKRVWLCVCLDIVRNPPVEMSPTVASNFSQSEPVFQWRATVFLSHLTVETENLRRVSNILISTNECPVCRKPKYHVIFTTFKCLLNQQRLPVSCVIRLAS